ncbi:MAG: dephospho-CoA kinase [Burkholderiaceae bacterium]|jgi:dephospho-CoA kinase
MRTAVVVLTGGIGSGKTAACQEFASLGVPIVDADQIAHALTGPEGAAMPQIRQAFGDAALEPDGRLNRVAMRERAFHHPSVRAQLEAILHPLIQAHAKAALEASDAPYTVYAVPLWAEGAGRQRPHWVWKVVVVDVPLEVQRMRVLQRQPIAAATLDRIIALQASREQRLALADVVIQNHGSAQDLSTRIQALHDLWLHERLQPTGPDSLSNQT